jgi:phosphate transport system protein
LEYDFDKNLIEELQIQNMTNICLEMVDNIISAYEHDDTESARLLFEKDAELNALNKAGMEILSASILSNPTEIDRLLRLLILIRKLERTGDLIKSMAEEIIFYVEAKVIRHGNNTMKGIN